MKTRRPRWTCTSLHAHRSAEAYWKCEAKKAIRKAKGETT